MQSTSATSNLSPGFSGLGYLTLSLRRIGRFGVVVSMQDSADVSRCYNCGLIGQSKPQRIDKQLWLMLLGMQWW